MTEINTDKRRYLTLFPEGWTYAYFDFSLDLPGTSFDIRFPGLRFSTHLFGVDSGQIHLFGTDSAGKGHLRAPPCTPSTPRSPSA